MGITSIRTNVILILMFGIITLSSCIHLPPNNKHAEIHAIIDKANAEFYLDQRIWYQDVHAEINGQTILLTGEAFYSIPVKGIARKLKQAGFKFEFIDSVHYLPETFPDDLAYGIISEPYVMGRYKPVGHKQEGTEMLWGEPVRLIREKGDYLQVQSAIGYLGYIPKDALRRVKLEEWNRYHVGEQAIFTKNVTLENGLIILMGTRLPYLGNDLLLLADGNELQLSPDHYKLIDPANNPLRQEILNSAEQYLDLPYVWGGRSAEGVDCSGLVMQSYALNNIYLPRDSDEIANVGRMVGYPGWMEAMLPGDILFFAGSRRMITHTAIYMGEGKVIHSLGKGVQIQSMNPDDPDYSSSLERRFVFAKRIFE
ncbi:MAG: C40 family peptidase [Candidatus Marinimicrobia bacterium]|jgi:gamma-D-glutamyl-L-lysine dipeptidyl-peptidase|nr:C40 family peptidase [Candidatus Neomarinimicrobiota bacterium]MBT4360489.1 C40 family peptidase [Candidatus Neomarinimicrobiota bacterium]MBT4716242.1 C40 family peptidase [Candidatus Neomarinimicrobiota bacterium]MBT4945296.1 C40 family peptidase [Candidatus Neomarinimicrobiota bacterium]MBT5269210.1 C40 family peptidase [Candidatus Neomarinimicrobiota bacterium]